MTDSAGLVQRETRARVAAWRRVVAGLEAMADAALLDPTGARALAEWVLSVRCLAQGELKNGFGVDPEVDRPQISNVANLAEGHQLNALLTAWLLFDAAWQCGSRAAEQANEDGGDVKVAFISEVMRVLRELPVVLAAQGGTAHPLEFERQSSALSLAAWAATRISLSPYKAGDLRYALASEGTSPYEALLDQLPGAVFTAWQDVLSGEPSRKLLNELIQRTARLLKAHAPRRHDLTLADSAPGVNAPSLEEEFFSREEVRAAFAAAELTVREEEVLELMRQGVPQTEIATRLGLAEGTVYALSHRARKKLRKNAGGAEN